MVEHLQSGDQTMAPEDATLLSKLDTLLRRGLVLRTDYPDSEHGAKKKRHASSSEWREPLPSNIAWLLLHMSPT